MADHTATATLWPSANDVNDGTAGAGKNLLELSGAPWRQAWETNYVISGFLVPSSSANLDLSVPSGFAMLSGRRVVIGGSTTVTAANNTSNFLFLKFTVDGNSKGVAVKYEVNTSGTEPANATFLAVLVTSGGVITNTLDCRRIVPISADPWGGVNTTSTGSNYAQEGHIIQSSSTNWGGLRLYGGVKIAAGVTITGNQSALVIEAERSIDIAGTINMNGLGAVGGSGGTSPFNGTNATDQPGGGGGGNGAGISGARGGDAGINGVALNVGGSGGAGSGSTGTQVAGTTLMRQKGVVEALGGAAGGGGGGGANGGVGGTGGGSIVLMAPIVRLRSTAVLSTNGTQGVAGSSGNAGGGGGGSAGNIWIICRKGFFTNDGATFTQVAGTGGAGVGTGAAGGSGQGGVKQILEIL